MNDYINKPRVSMTPKKLSLIRTAVVAALAGFSLGTQAGLITTAPSDTVPGKQDGYGGWNLDNVEVIISGTLGAIGDPNTSWFDESDGSYNFGLDADNTYITDVEDGLGNVMGHALAKDFPVGEPAGIKIVNDDFDVKVGRPTNCVMSTSYLEDHFLDTADPKQVPCSGPFQSHKRYKLAILPTTVADGPGLEKGIDLIFNVEQDGTSRDYQIFQKINNWTDERLQGFTIQVGTGLGADFVPASDAAGVGVANLSLSVPSDVWNASQLATFSSGLFGPIDPKHGRPAGYFDPTTRAGYTIVEYGAGNTGDVSGQIDTLTSGATLGSSYADVPAGAGAAANQFGNWLPDSMLPYGIFFDEDADPETDAELAAWYGHNPATGMLQWMTGDAGGFSIVADATITSIWSTDPLYSMGPIDDLVNIGLNYVVTIADISSFPGYNVDPLLNAATFTLRITPKAETVATPPPTYVGVIPSPSLTYTSTTGVVSLTSFPAAVADEFVPGSVLTATVADADLNLDPGVVDTATVSIEATVGTVIAATPLTITELGADRGVFAATLPDAFSNVLPSTVVTVTYTDASLPGDITDSLTALPLAPPGTLQFNPVAYSVEENDGSVDVLVTRTGGTAGEVAVEYQTISGTAIAAEDYVSDEGSVTFADGDATDQVITVVILNNDAAEPTKTFELLLSNAQGGATLGTDDTAEVTLTDTDVDPAGTLQFNPASYSIGRNEGSIELTVERTGGEAGEATVDFLTLAGTAHGGEDYVVQTGTLTFADGSSTSQTITVAILDDSSEDGEEVFTVQLSGATVADLGAADLATVTITDELVYRGTKSDGLFSFNWMTVGLVLIGLLARTRRKIC